MTRFSAFVLALSVFGAFAAGNPAPANAQGAVQTTAGPPIQITWEVRNRFRMFREERDFALHAEALRNRTILASEQALAVQSDGRGWARNTLSRLCIDQLGSVSEPCTRDGVKESYLTPADHPVTVRLTGNVPVGAICAWAFDDGDGPRQSSADCSEPVNLRVRYGKPTAASVDVSSGSEASQRVATDITVRDVLIAGLGDSVASGEGNPDRPVALADEGFCFRSYLGGPTSQYFRPSRAGFTGTRACENSGSDALNGWQRRSAQWSNQACHRSLYSYQTRAAIALSVQHPHIAVTFLPLACTGATVTEGLLGSQRGRECLVTRNAINCETTVSAQVTELREALTAAKRRQPARQLDLILLSIGANDINFSGLVADVIVDGGTERALTRRGGVMGTVDESRKALARELPQRFGKLREALKPLIGADMSKVIFTSYANPTYANGTTCTGGPGGFDVHPSFNADPRRLGVVSDYVQSEFLPQLRNIATCGGGILCKDPARDRMTFVDSHLGEFNDHGFCARSATDPEFDRQCFSAKGDSFNTDLVEAANSPMACGRGASEFRAYAPRARWIRDANDSYFTAMTYPQGVSGQPSDIHDATWGILSAVYGGAIHPTAEGHAAMADAAWPAITDILGLAANEGDVTRQPLPDNAFQR